MESGESGEVSVGILVLSSASAGPVSLTHDLFRAADGLRGGELMGVYGPRWRWKMCSLDGGDVRLQGGISVETSPLSALGDVDVVVIPGLGIPEPAALLARLAEEDVVRAGQWLVDCAAKGVVIASSCTATFLVASAGLLDGRKATTTWWLSGVMREHFGEIEVAAKEVLCRDGHIWTAGASLGHLDLCLSIVEHWAGAAMSRAVSRLLLLPHEPRSQAAQMMTDHLRHTDPLMLEAESWIASRVEEPIKVPELAKAMGKSPRTLARLFERKAGLTPRQLISRVRLREASRLLETTEESVDAIAEAVGFSDTSAFWRSFRKAMKITPAAYRKQWKRKTHA